MAKEVLRTASIIEAELNAAKKESDEAESALDALDNQREALVLKGAYEQVVELEKKTDLQRLRLEGAGKRTRLLAEELNDLRKNENFAVLAARAAEMRADKQRNALLSDLQAALSNVCAVLSKIQQHNAESNEINPTLLNAGIEPIPLFDVRITHLPGAHSLIGWLTNLFPIFVLEPVERPSWPGRAAYPKAVQGALARLDEEKRVAFAAAHRRPDPEPGPGRLAVGYGLRPGGSQDGGNS
jgi:hypothetical protein